MWDYASKVICFYAIFLIFLCVVVYIEFEKRKAG